jgi:hypothetical protein
MTTSIIDSPAIAPAQSANKSGGMLPLLLIVVAIVMYINRDKIKIFFNSFPKGMPGASPADGDQ